MTRRRYVDPCGLDSRRMSSPQPRCYGTAAHCQDCGQHRNVTIIRWWASGFTYRVCADCIKPYRGLILAAAG